MEYRKVTLLDVAKRSGVSLASVSAVLNGKAGRNIRVSEATHSRILEAARFLGYVPNAAARSLKDGNKSLIAVFTYENMFLPETYNEYYDFFMGVQRQTEREGLDLLLLNTRKNLAGSSRITMASGAIMIGVNRDDADIKMLVQRNFPLVFVGRRSIADVKTFCVTFDYKSVIDDFMLYLSGKNCTGILYVKETGDKNEPSADKQKFLADAAAQYGIPMRVLETAGDGSRVDMLLDIYKPGDVIVINRFKLCDSIGQLIQSRNLQLGTDIRAVVLEDDWQRSNPEWTCWTNQRQELGALAVQHLSRIVQEQPDDDLPLLVTLSIRKGKSC